MLEVAVFQPSHRIAVELERCNVIPGIVKGFRELLTDVDIVMIQIQIRGRCHDVKRGSGRTAAFDGLFQGVVKFEIAGEIAGRVGVGDITRQQFRTGRADQQCGLHNLLLGA